MSDDNNGGGTIISSPEGLRMFHLLQWKYALKLEMVGMKHSQGSVYAHVKRQLGFKGNKQRVYDQLVAYIEKVHAGNQIETPSTLQ